MSKINSHNYEAFVIDYFDGNLSELLIAELKAFVLANPQLDIDLNDLDLPSFANDEIKVDFKDNLKKAETFLEDEELINYLENNLSGANKKSFELKLATDVSLNKEFEAYKKTILINEPALVFNGKGELVKTDDDLILNNTALAYVEGKLEASEKLQFETELKRNPALQKEVLLFNKTKLEASTAIQFPDKGSLKKETKVIALFSFRKLASMAAAILLLIGLAFVFNYYNSKPIILKELANTTANKTNKVNDITDSSNSSVNQNKTLMANNGGNLVASKAPRKEKYISTNTVKTNSIVLNNTNQVFFSTPDSSNDNESKVVIVNTNTAKVDTANLVLASVISDKPKYTKQNYLIIEEVDEDEAVALAPAKKGFWKRAVTFAKQANKLGVKSLDGEETSNQNYLLSFNSFSVEKR